MVTKPLQISNSEIQTFKDCRRRWYLTYFRELGMKRENGRAVGARELGTRMHMALEVLYTEPDKDAMATLDSIYQSDIATVAERPDYSEDMLVAMRKEHTLARAMLEGFLVWRAEEGIDDGMELVAAETVIEVPFTPVHGVNLRGKLDQRWHRKRDGARLFRDWKTVGDMKTSIQLLPIDEQMKFYHLLEYLESMRETGRAPQWRTDGGQYVMLRKVLRTTKANPPFYDSVEVRHNKHELESMWFRVIKICQEIVAARAALEKDGDHRYVVPPRPSRDCSWKCDFFAVCPMMDDGSNWEGLLREYYTHIDPHERYNAQDEGREVTQ